MTTPSPFLLHPANSRLVMGESFVLGIAGDEGIQHTWIACCNFDLDELAKRAMQQMVVNYMHYTAADFIDELETLLAVEKYAMKPLPIVARHYLVRETTAHALREAIGLSTVEAALAADFTTPYVPEGSVLPPPPAPAEVAEPVMPPKNVAPARDRPILYSKAPGHPEPQLPENAYFTLRMGVIDSLIEVMHLQTTQAINLDQIFDKLVRSSSMGRSVEDFLAELVEKIQSYGAVPVERIPFDTPFIIFHVRANPQEAIGERGSIRAVLWETFHGETSHAIAQVKHTSE